MDKEAIKILAVKCGFKLKAVDEHGEPDLHEYVYDFAQALLYRNEHLRRKTMGELEKVKQELATSRAYGERLRQQIKDMAEGSIK